MHKRFIFLENGIRFLSRPGITMTQNKTVIQGCQYTSYFNRSLHSNAYILVVARSIEPSQSSAPIAQFAISMENLTTEENNVVFETFALPKVVLEYRSTSGNEFVCAFLLGGLFYLSNASKVYGNPGTFLLLHHKNYSVQFS